MPSTACSTGASSNTMFAALPPSSRVTFLPVPATEPAISLPTSVEPVKATLFTSGCPTTAAPVSPAPVAMLTTPGGSPTCWHTSASRSAVSGVVSAGLSTHVLPAASAGASFHAAISQGKFHVTRLADWLAVVQALQHGEFARPLLQHSGDPVQVLGPLAARHAAPDLLIGPAGRLDSGVDVGLACLGDHR